MGVVGRGVISIKMITRKLEWYGELRKQSGLVWVVELISTLLNSWEGKLSLGYGNIWKT